MTDGDQNITFLTGETQLENIIYIFGQRDFLILNLRT